MQSEKEGRTIRLSAGTMTSLRGAFERCLESEKELAGVFEVAKNELLFVQAQEGFEGKGGDWIASSTEDAPFTWHTHPILFGESESPVNVGSSVMASGEDLVGLVQDDARNEHFLSNAKGKGVFDCILTVAGILVVGTSQELIEKWGEMSRIDESNKEDWIASYNLGRKCKKLPLEELKLEVQKKAFAKIENAYNFYAFQEHCGAFGNFGKGHDSVFDRLWKNCPYIGYHTWWPKSQLPQDEKTEWDTSKPKLRMAAIKLVQMRWFKSRTFLECEVHKVLLLDLSA
jgi:hypothetical protein